MLARLCKLFAVLALIPVLLATQAKSQTDAALTAKSAHADAISNRLASTGNVRVIVELQATISPELYGDTGIGLATVERLSRSAQAAVLQTHVGADQQRRRRWGIREISHFPILAMTVTASELASLAADTRVARIWEDRLSAPGLSSTLPIVGMPAAYELNATGSGMMVAILDTGVEASHQFLTPRVTHEACFSSNVPAQQATSLCPNRQETQTGAGAAAPCSIAGCDHGTHVAGIAAGQTTIRSSPANGVAPNAKIFAIQVFSRFDNSTLCTASGKSTPCILSYDSDQLAALSHVLAMRSSVSATIAAANMSLGGGEIAGTCDTDARKSVIDQLRTVGIATVIAAGNSGERNAISAPACISTSVSVGSTDDSDAVSSFSNMSAAVDLLAPGSSVVSSVTGNAMGSKGGTSMAAPHVAGAFAVIRQHFPSATVTQIETALKDTGKLVFDNRTSGQHIKPRIRVDLALNKLGVNNATFAVLPATGLTATTTVGGSISPSSKTYRLLNNGPRAVNWTATSSNTDIATVTPSSGALGAGAQTNVTVAFPPIASARNPGTVHNALISFTNSSNLGNTSRHADLTIAPGGPPNDNFANATVIFAGQTLTGTNNGATLESGESVFHSSTKTVWWRYRAPFSGRVTMHTCGSNFDTALTVFTGTSVNALSMVVHNDQATFGPCASTNRSAVSFNATFDTVYYIQVYGFANNTGFIALNVEQPFPCLDNFADASVLSGTSGAVGGTIVGATGQAGEPNHAANSTPLNSVWCRWTAPMTGAAEFEVTQSSFDTTIAVYQGSAVNALRLIAHNDNQAPLVNRSLVTFAAVAGQTYYIALDGVGSATGTYALDWRQNAAGSTSIVSAVLPYARSTTPGRGALTLGQIINTGTTAARGCTLGLPAGFGGTFVHQRLKSDGSLDGNQFDATDIPSGSAQGWVFQYVPSTTFTATDIPIVFDCLNTQPAPVVPGANTFLVSVSPTLPPDLLMYTVTTAVPDDKIIRLPGPTGTNIVGMISQNVGAAGTITVSADDNGRGLPLTTLVCKVTPSLTCAAPPTPTVTVSMSPNQVETFTVFVTGNGDIAPDPADNRIYIRMKDQTGETRGATAVAVQTAAP